MSHLPHYLNTSILEGSHQTQSLHLMGKHDHTSAHCGVFQRLLHVVQGNLLVNDAKKKCNAQAIITL